MRENGNVKENNFLIWQRLQIIMTTFIPSLSYASTVGFHGKNIHLHLLALVLGS